MPVIEPSSRLRLLDLFCGAGGAAMGYHRAGFDVVGVDIRPQPNYPFEFVQGDALEFLDCLDAGGVRTTTSGFVSQSDHYLWNFDAIHASPPCQHYANVTRWRGIPTDHPDLIAGTRGRLDYARLPWVIENVRTRHLRADFMLCGTMFGLPFRRHRHFETNWSGLVMSHPCQHVAEDFSFDHGGKQPESVYRGAIGVDWMTVSESREAIPPAYTEHIGGYLMAEIGAAANAGYQA